MTLENNEQSFLQRPIFHILLTPFIQNLNEYEKLLSATDDEASLLIIERQILSCYESVVQND